jgi:hypothetical protein
MTDDRFSLKIDAAHHQSNNHERDDQQQPQVNQLMMPHDSMHVSSHGGLILTYWF